jgi:ankyrin repeat protein
VILKKSPTTFSDTVTLNRIVIGAISMSEQFITAIKSGDTNTVAMLLKESPNLIRETKSPISPIMLSMYFGQKQVAELLVQSGISLTLHEAAVMGKVERVQEILRTHPERLEESSSDGFSILGFAAYFGHEALAQCLLEQGAAVNHKSNNTMMVAPLHSAVSAQHVGIVRLLLEHGANANLPQEQGIRPLHQAAHNGDTAITRLLLEHGADPMLASDNGKTAVDWAKEDGHTTVVDLLQNHC